MKTDELTVDENLIKEALKKMGKNKDVVWAKDFKTVEVMISKGIPWKTICSVLNDKYKKALAGKELTVNGAVRDYKTYYLNEPFKKPARKTGAKAIEEEPIELV